MTVLAKMSLPLGMFYSIMWLLACGAILTASLYHPDDLSLEDYLENKGLFRYEIAITCWFACALVALRQIVILKQLLFSGQRVIWADGKKIYYLNLFSSILVSSVQREEIVAVFAGNREFFDRRGVILSLRDQSEVFISTWVMIDSAEMIAGRIRELLSIPTQWSEMRIQV